MPQPPKHSQGDLVRLKSGGPNMTIVNVRPSFGVGPATGLETYSYSCAWFADGHLSNAHFPEETLTEASVHALSLQYRTENSENGSSGGSIR